VTESVVWQECWRRLEVAFAAAAETLRACNPSLWSQFGYRMSEERPFEAWAEFKRVENPAGIEDIVVFFAVVRDGDYLRSTVDISTGEGVVLAEVPTHTVDTAEAWQGSILDRIAAAEQLLNGSRDLLREALC
jgi:hypothetical protein